MSMKKVCQDILSRIGVEIDGDNPWDIQIHNPRAYSRVLSGGSLALGESYMDGWWDCKAIDQLIHRVLRADLDKKVVDKKGLVLAVLQSKLMNMQKGARAFEIGKRHYDIGNDLYKAMLDKRMMYSCGYWKNAKNLDQAQEAKLDLICRKLQLKEGMTLLDIGCGWGGLLKYAAEKYGVKGVGITVSKEQAELARKTCKGFPVEIRLQDYRDVKERFDSIVSVGMFEHVGHKNYRTFMKVVNRCLKPKKLFLLHTIGSNVSSTAGDPWISKYIFPNSILPSLHQTMESAEGVFVLEDLHNFGPDYDKTLMAWHDNFLKSWNDFEDQYGKRFFRMWKYYLLSCAGSFRSRKIQLWQFVFSKKGVDGGYCSVR